MAVPKKRHTKHRRDRRRRQNAYAGPSLARINDTLAPSHRASSAQPVYRGRDYSDVISSTSKKTPSRKAPRAAASRKTVKKAA